MLDVQPCVVSGFFSGSLSFSGGRPVYIELRDEIVEMVGDWAYQQLVDHVQRITEARDDCTFLPHPALRR